MGDRVGDRTDQREKEITKEQKTTSLSGFWQRKEQERKRERKRETTSLSVFLKRKKREVHHVAPPPPCRATLSRRSTKRDTGAGRRRGAAAWRARAASERLTSPLPDLPHRRGSVRPFERPLSGILTVWSILPNLSPVMSLDPIPMPSRRLALTPYKGCFAWRRLLGLPL